MLRHGLAYALAFSKAAVARDAAKDCLERGIRSAEDVDQWEGTALCARALGDFGKAEDVALLASAMEHPDYRVAVEAVRTLARFVQLGKENADRGASALTALGALHRNVELLAKGDVAKGAHPLLMLSKMELPAQGRPLLTELRRRLAVLMDNAAPPVLHDLATIDCRLAAAQDRSEGLVDHVNSCGLFIPPLAWRLALALGQMSLAPEKPVPVRGSQFAEYLKHSSSQVRIAALGAISALKYAPAADQVRSLIAGNDAVVSSYASSTAGALGDKAAVTAILKHAAALTAEQPDLTDGVAEGLVELKAPEARALLQRWLGSPQSHVRDVAAQSLRKLGQKVDEVPLVSMKPGPPPEPVQADAEILFRTEKGEFTVKLDAERNPRAAANLWWLARRGFFNGLTFHRVEPDFVVQGGDPRGDGDGGPGYTTRCEISDRRYERGTIGMALSGKDTGGSQFFFATSAQPHLDGRYTAFGEVATGMEVVDRLMEGDVIEQATALP
jgi:cyclophilin family peptidyl-prolyl cis-trans isomerase